MNYLKTKLGDWFYLIPILLIGFGVYLNSLPNKFVWDDEEMIVNNPVVHNIGNMWGAFIGQSFFNSGGGVAMGGYYRPLPTFLYTIFWHWWGSDPTPYRVVQILLHLVALALIFFVIKKLLNLQKVKSATQIAAVSTLIFAVHPANVETVQYVADLGSVLYPLFALSSFLLFLRSIRSDRKMSIPLLVLSILLIGIALLAQEGAIVMAAVVALYFIIFLRDRWFYLIHYMVGSILIYGIYLMLRMNIAHVGYSFVFSAPLAKAGLMARALTFPFEAISYLRLVFWPATLSVNNQFVVSSASDVRFWGSIIGLIFIIGLIIWLMRFFKNRALALFLIGWFVLILGPMLNIIPLDLSISEHWLYLPMIAAILLVVWLVFETKNNWPHLLSSLLPHLFIIIILVLAGRTMVRNMDWRDGMTLYAHDVKSNQSSPSLFNNLGVEYFRVGDLVNAKNYFQKSVDIDADWSTSQNNLGVIDERAGNLENAMQHYTRAIEIDDYFLAYENKANTLYQQKRYTDAVNFALDVLRKLPNNANIQIALGLSYIQLGDINTGAQWLRSALSLDPNNATAYRALVAVSAGGQ